MEKVLENLLFLDIETVGQTHNYDTLDERTKTQWARKASFLRRDENIDDAQLYSERAGIYAEFGKIVTIGLGFFAEEPEGNVVFRTTAIAGDDEKTLLHDFVKVLNRTRQTELRLCAHNGREFDFPYLSRRILINGIKLPYALDNSGKKPWEINHLDTMDMWKFGDWKHYTSLELMATIFNIESSKSDLDGSKVSDCYYLEKDLDKIKEYCIQDVIVTARLFLKLKSLGKLLDEQIIRIDH